jgi:hypothetical protein
MKGPGGAASGALDSIGVGRPLSTRERFAGLRRLGRVDLAVVGLLIVGPIVLLALSLGMTFFADEWTFIRYRSLADPANWFVPHGEHWSTLPIIVYRSLFEIFGLRTYVPYIALVLLLHAIVVLLIYRLVRISCGPKAAAGVAFVAMFLGSGADNIFWGFQIGAVGATALCLASLLVLEGPPALPAAIVALALMLAALATHGIAVPMIATVGASMALRRPWRPYLPVVVIASAVYLGWLVVVGRQGISVQGDQLSLAALMRVPFAAVAGLSTAAGAWTGFGPWFGGIPAAALLVLAIYLAVKRRLPDRFVACLVGLVAFYGLVGLTRAMGGIQAAEASRLTYFGAALFVVGASSVVGRIRRPRENWKRVPLVAGVAVISTLCVVWNLASLAYTRQISLAWADITRAWIALELRQPPIAPVTGEFLDLLPDRAGLIALIERYGSPLEDPFAPPPPPAALSKVERYLLDGAPWPVPG